MKITIPPEIERALTVHARRRGTTAELVALDSLRERFVREPTKRRRRDDEGNGRKTLADFLKGYVGVLHSSELVGGRQDVGGVREEVRSSADREAQQGPFVMYCGGQA